MEKFTKWADKGSSINPFVPARRRGPGGVLGALRLAAGAPLALARLALLPPSLALAALLSLLASPLLLAAAAVAAAGAGLSSARALDALNPAHVALALAALFAALRWGAWLVAAAMGRWLLFLLGVVADEAHANYRTLGLAAGHRAQGGKEPGSPVRAVGAGHLLICNWQSPLEVLYLWSRFAPAFAFPAGAGAPEVQVVSVWRALRRSLGWGGVASNVSLADALARAGKHKQPLVVFPEGARTNGKAVLQFEPVVAALPKAARVHIVGFKFAFKHFSPAFTTSRPLRHLFWTAFQVYNRVRVQFVTADRAPPGPLSGATAQQLLCSMLRVRPVALGAADHASFVAYWEAIASGDKALAATLADARARAGRPGRPSAS